MPAPLFIAGNYFYTTIIALSFVAKILSWLLISWHLNRLNESPFFIPLLVTPAWHYK